ncbi:hypothetical protein F5Y16DRAFT_394537 [Xylariaceae sp. FL0255]|nr:hypothetical protein F5Y16DRAFT_394537 [Xylariaceae sp. FL0255]
MTIITVILALAAIISEFGQISAQLPTPPLPPWYPLQGWQISSLSTYNPHESPYGTNASGLFLNITNPQQIAAAPAPYASGGGYIVFDASSALCELHWKTGEPSSLYRHLIRNTENTAPLIDSVTPYGYSSNSCTVADQSAHWEVTLNEVHEDLSSPSDHYMSFSFELVLNETFFGSIAYKRMFGGIVFDTSTNLQGGCGANGLCQFELKNGTSPVLLQPTLEDCMQACG